MTVLIMLSLVRPLSAQVSGQSFQITAEAARATVGDTVTLRFRVRLDDRDLPFDTIPRAVGALAPGIRVLEVEKLARTPDRLFHGVARVAFYRPGRQPVPTFGLPFMRAVKGVQRATLVSDSAFVTITPVLPAGNPPLKDIKPLEQLPASLFSWFTLAVGLALGLGLYFLSRRRHRPAASVEEPGPTAQPLARSPYQIALDRLAGLEEEHWIGQGKVAVHYEAVVEILREYLEEAEEIKATECTTSELLWALPPHLSGTGLRDRCYDVLSEADLVKFARLEPDEASAHHFLERARLLVQAWHNSAPIEQSANAVR